MDPNYNQNISDKEKEKEKYLNLFLKNIEFAKTYISVYYPFAYNEILTNWDILVHGDAFYPCFIIDIEQTFIPSFGLCYNNNIKWNSKLRVRWEYGIFDPFKGGYIGLNSGLESDHFENQDISYSDTIIPLSIEKYIESIISINFQFNSEPNFDYISEITDYPKYEMNNFDFLEFEKIFFKNQKIILWNNSFWDKKLKYIIDKNFISNIFPNISLDYGNRSTGDFKLS